MESRLVVETMCAQMWTWAKRYYCWPMNEKTPRRTLLTAIGGNPVDWGLAHNSLILRRLSQCMSTKTVLFRALTSLGTTTFSKQM
ncbi:hypothetical protein CEXT_531511 [Caerostris extrusa]|uniref:Uncharacterized protein n=1 Tax=Caerostris extrusa TaxID=172846 RepID=A0AAV4W9B8_CAEEX|nr:hypothetical protein CEXT_531511 [Caerostris extrusa]